MALNNPGQNFFSSVLTLCTLALELPIGNASIFSSQSMFGKGNSAAATSAIYQNIPTSPVEVYPESSNPNSYLLLLGVTALLLTGVVAWLGYGLYHTCRQQHMLVQQPDQNPTLAERWLTPADREALRDETRIMNRI